MIISKQFQFLIYLIDSCKRAEIWYVYFGCIFLMIGCLFVQVNLTENVLSSWATLAVKGYFVIFTSSPG